MTGNDAKNKKQRRTEMKKTNEQVVCVNCGAIVATDDAARDILYRNCPECGQRALKNEEGLEEKIMVAERDGDVHNLNYLKSYLSALGKKGGSAKSAAKVAASRANGAKGGRPKAKKA
jgi:DNA-directed RNA polymerase subunit RPC12/RpoP